MADACKIICICLLLTVVIIVGIVAALGGALFAGINAITTAFTSLNSKTDNDYCAENSGLFTKNDYCDGKVYKPGQISGAYCHLIDPETCLHYQSCRIWTPENHYTPEKKPVTAQCARKRFMDTFDDDYYCTSPVYSSGNLCKPSANGGEEYSGTLPGGMCKDLALDVRMCYELYNCRMSTDPDAMKVCEKNPNGAKRPLADRSENTTPWAEPQGSDPPLPALSGKEPSASGIGNGCEMSAMLHVIHSAFFLKGFGCTGGAPFLMKDSVRYLQAAGHIDDIENLKQQKVYIHHGNRDTVYNVALGNQLKDFYSYFVQKPQNVESSKIGVDGYHTYPSNKYCGENPAADCNEVDAQETYGVVNSPFDFPANAIEWIYGNTYAAADVGDQPGNGQTATLNFFSQEEFCRNAAGAETCADIYLSSRGFYYAPEGCKNGEGCPVHASFHGCGMCNDNQGFCSNWARLSGMIEVADVHKIIVVWPNAAWDSSFKNGCFNTDGYRNHPGGEIDADRWYTKENRQVKAIKAMIERIMEPNPNAESEPQGRYYGK